MKKFAIKRILLVLLMFFGLQLTNTNAQSEQEDGFGFGFQLNQFQKDFGLGVNVSSPSILKQTMCIRLRVNAMFYEYINNDLKVDWQPYTNIMLGFSSASYKINEAIALYGEGGIIAILPSTEFSSSSLDIGGYGLFGFEFYFYDGFCYFLEAGGVGSSATADEVPTEPIYSNGFTMSVGLKIKL